MLKKTISGAISLITGILMISCNSPELPKPSQVQYQWHEQERLMFIHFAPTTWTEKEQNDHSVSLDRINPRKLDTDQWCEAARAWGAKQIIFVAKHTGGFCWWQTQTTEYGIRNTPYKDGKGDILKELSQSCKKFGLNLGVYIYPGDRTWGAMIGSGGKTQDPSKQEAYNKVFRTQLKEVLTNYGKMAEVWFDGSCVIDVSDILEEHARNAVIFQGPQASVRWPGTESGKLFYPAWNALKKEDLKTGVSTQFHGDPDGDAWAPLEADTPLYDHFWFWSPRKAKKRKSLNQLMEIYYQSAGYGGVLLLNATPDTTGLIPAADMERYREFGHEINRRFGQPLATAEDQKGEKVNLHFEKPTRINHVIIMEDYRKGERIREYKIEGLTGGNWIELTRGISVGQKKIDFFNQKELDAVRLIITKSAGRPLIRSFAAYYVRDFTPPEKKDVRVWARPVVVAGWKKEDMDGNTIRLKVDLNKKMNLPGQYILSVIPEDPEQLDKIIQAKMFYNGNQAMGELVSIRCSKIHLNQTAQIKGDSEIFTDMEILLKAPCNGEILFAPELIHQGNNP